MPVEELAPTSTETPQLPDIYHYYPRVNRKLGDRVSIGDKAKCGYICTQVKTNYPHGIICVVCAELERT